jgi:hypothetical protein
MSQDPQRARRSGAPRPSAEDELKTYSTQQVEPNKALPGTMSWKAQRGAFQEMPKDFKPSPALRFRQALSLYAPILILALGVLVFVVYEMFFGRRGIQP